MHITSSSKLHTPNCNQCLRKEKEMYAVKQHLQIQIDVAFEVHFCSTFPSEKENESLHATLNSQTKFSENTDLVDVRDTVGFGEGLGLLGRQLFDGHFLSQSVHHQYTLHPLHTLQVLLYVRLTVRCACVVLGGRHLSQGLHVF